MKISLTIDNGPDPDQTAGVLDVLAARGVPATFFVLGERVSTPWGRALAEQARAEGHRLGNHTWSHRQPLGELEDPDASVAEIERAQAALGALADPERLFRPFGRGGAIGPHLLSRAAYEHLAARGYTCVLWNSVPRDWEDPQWVDTALAQAGEHDWTVTVVHDVAPDAARRIDAFVAAALDRGAAFDPGFPRDCVPMLRGEARDGMERYVTDP